MAYKWILSIILITNVCCESDEEHHKQTRSLLASKTSQFNILSGNFEDQNSPQNYFPDIEYPKDILDVAKPYYFQASGDTVLEPFPRDVKESFKLISSEGKTVVEPVEKPVRKIEQPIVKTSSNFLNSLIQKPKNKTFVLNKTNSTSVLLENKHVNSVEEVKNDRANVTSPENNTETTDSHENANSTEDNLTLYATNLTFNSHEIDEESQEKETRLDTTNVSSSAHKTGKELQREETNLSATNVAPSSQINDEESQEEETCLSSEKTVCEKINL